MLKVGFRLSIAGRLGRLAAFRRILERLDAYGDRLEVARRIDIARAWAQFPA